MDGTQGQYDIKVGETIFHIEALLPYTKSDFFNLYNKPANKGHGLDLEHCWHQVEKGIRKYKKANGGAA
ncbi:hypothetical protein [Ferruginibacter sp.]|uniref:hypothetical protein n=1 Tax=Ferruginibacter sp. TaxID=1940288 RepID=UPI002659073D|nr:hypothetical protein [Ferruginibacter sp.]